MFSYQHMLSLKPGVHIIATIAIAEKEFRDQGPVVQNS